MLSANHELPGTMLTVFTSALVFQLDTSTVDASAPATERNVPYSTMVVILGVVGAILLLLFLVGTVTTFVWRKIKTKKIRMYQC